MILPHSARRRRLLREGKIAEGQMKRGDFAFLNFYDPLNMAWKPQKIALSPAQIRRLPDVSRDDIDDLPAALLLILLLAAGCHACMARRLRRQLLAMQFLLYDGRGISRSFLLTRPPGITHANFAGRYYFGRAGYALTAAALIAPYTFSSF